MLLIYFLFIYFASFLSSYQTLYASLLYRAVSNINYKTSALKRDVVHIANL